MLKFQTTVLDKMNKNFSRQNNMWTISLFSCDKVCRLKCESGLRIRKDQDVNVLTKLGWKVLKDPNNLRIRVVFVKYLTKSNFLEAKKSDNVSRLWKYILDHRYLLKNCVRHDNIKFWHDNWIATIWGMVIKSSFGTTIRWWNHFSSIKFL